MQIKLQGRKPVIRNEIMQSKILLHNSVLCLRAITNIITSENMHDTLMQRAGLPKKVFL